LDIWEKKAMWLFNKGKKISKKKKGIKRQDEERKKEKWQEERKKEVGRRMNSSIHRWIIMWTS
jgi:hypothetical protein